MCATRRKAKLLLTILFFVGIAITIGSFVIDQMTNSPFLMRTLAPSTERLWIGLEEVRRRSGCLEEGRTGFAEVVALASRIGLENLSLDWVDSSLVGIPSSDVKSVEFSGTIIMGAPSVHEVVLRRSRGGVISTSMERLDGFAAAEFSDMIRRRKVVLFPLGVAMSIIAFLIDKFGRGSA
jgi:hypothetical protein